MTETTMSDEPKAVADRRPSTVRCTLYGAGLGLLMGIGMSGFDYLLRAGSLRDIALTTNLIVYPVIGAVLGALTSRNPNAGSWNSPADFFATEPLSAEERETRERRIRKSVWIGFGGGIVVALAASAIDFAWRGWPFLSQTLGFNLFFYPYLGALSGLNLGLRSGDPKPSIRNVRFSMRTLMILTAYIAFALSLVARTSGLSNAARQYHDKAQNARMTGAVYQPILDRALKDAERTKNADALRAGRIPEGLLDSQKAFLKSLDQSATDEYKKYRYGLIADGEQRLAKIAEGNVDIYSRLVDYHKTLAAKYAKAAHEPWLPVEPDPPMPE